MKTFPPPNDGWHHRAAHVAVLGADFRREVADADATQVLYATVDRTGRLVSFSPDDAGRQKLPESMDRVLRNVRFMPALKAGAPVDGRMKVTLGQLAN